MAADKEREKEGTGSLTKSAVLRHFDLLDIFHVYKLLKTSKSFCSCWLHLWVFTTLISVREYYLHNTSSLEFVEESFCDLTINKFMQVY